jgi:hypothetical protein
MDVYSALNFFWLSEEHRLQAIDFPQSESDFLRSARRALGLSVGENYCAKGKKHPYGKMIGTLTAGLSALNIRGAVNCHK